MTLRILGAADVRRLLPMQRCIEATREAMTLTSSARACQPIRTKMDGPDGRGLLSMMPGWIADPERMGIKIVTVFPGNFGTGTPSHQGIILLCDPENGAPLAIVDGGVVTAMRTGAASAVATDALASPDAATLGIYGYGEQASAHIEALSLVRSLRRVLVWGRDLDKARAFAEEQATHRGLTVEARPDPTMLAAECELLCTTTAAAEPFFQGAWLRPGQHLNVVGSSIPTTAEVDVDTLRRARVFADYRESALALGGDIRRAIYAGLDADTVVAGEVGEVILGRVQGRRTPEDITLFKSLGMISEDLTSAEIAYRAAEAAGVGVVVDF